jgi:hypothetical protein
MARNDQTSVFELVKRRYGGQNAFRPVTVEGLSDPQTLPPCDILAIDLMTVAMALRDKTSIDRQGYLVPGYFNKVQAKITEIVTYARPQQWVHIAMSGQAPLAKAFRQRDAGPGKDYTSAFSDYDAIDPRGFYAVMKDWLSHAFTNLPISDRVCVVLDSNFTPGECDRKFGVWHRNALNAGTIRQGLRYTIYCPNRNAIEQCLVLHEPNVYLIRETYNHKTRKPIIDLVDLKLLRQGVMRDFQQSEAGIDDFITLWFLTGTKYFPGIAPYQSLERAYHSLAKGQYLVTNGLLNQPVLTSFLEQLLQLAGQEEPDVTDDPILCARYLRSVSWLTQYQFVGVPSWGWAYNSGEKPSIVGLLAAVATLDQTFARDAPINAIIHYAINNGMKRNTLGVPTPLANLWRHPRLGRFFQDDGTPIDPVTDLALFDSEIVQKMNANQRAALEKRIRPLVFRNGQVTRDEDWDPFTD